MPGQRKILLLTQSVKIATPTLASALTDFQLQSMSVLRKALAYIKKERPEVIIAEFIYAPTYGSQLSNFEALYASVQAHSPASRLIALVDNSDVQHLQRLRDRIPLERQLLLPLKIEDLISAVRGLE